MEQFHPDNHSPLFYDEEEEGIIRKLNDPQVPKEIEEMEAQAIDYYNSLSTEEREEFDHRTEKTIEKLHQRIADDEKFDRIVKKNEDEAEIQRLKHFLDS